MAYGLVVYLSQQQAWQKFNLVLCNLSKKKIDLMEFVHV